MPFLRNRTPPQSGVKRFPCGFSLKSEGHPSGHLEDVTFCGIQLVDKQVWPPLKGQQKECVVGPQLVKQASTKTRWPPLKGKQKEAVETIMIATHLCQRPGAAFQQFGLDSN